MNPRRGENKEADRFVCSACDYSTGKRSSWVFHAYGACYSKRLTAELNRLNRNCTVGPCRYAPGGRTFNRQPNKYKHILTCAHYDPEKDDAVKHVFGNNIRKVLLGMGKLPSWASHLSIADSLYVPEHMSPTNRKDDTSHSIMVPARGSVIVPPTTLAPATSSQASTQPPATPPDSATTQPDITDAGDAGRDATGSS